MQKPIIEPLSETAQAIFPCLINFSSATGVIRIYNKANAISMDSATAKYFKYWRYCNKGIVIIYYPDYF